MEIFKLFGSVFVDSSGANTALAEVDNKAKSTGSTLGGMVGTAAAWGAGIAVAAGAAGAGLFALVAQTSEAASAINDMSVRTGLSTTTLQELQFATGQVGVNFDAVTGAVGKLTQTMSGADAGSKQAEAAFKALGIATNDGTGHLRSMDDIFPEVISKLANMSNESDRNALAFKFFGKGAMELVPLLDAGGVGIEEMKKKAHDLGLVMSEDAVSANDEFGDSLDQVKSAVSAVGMQVANQFLPIFQKMLNWILSNMPKIQSFVQKAFSIIGKSISVAGDFINATTTFFRNHWNVIQPILGGIAAGAAAFIIITNAMKLYRAAIAIATVVQLAFNGAMIANPIGIIIVAVGALVAAGVYLYKNWDTVRINFLKIMDSLVYGVSSAMSWMKIKVLEGVLKVIDGLSKFADWIPGFSDTLGKAREKIANLIDAEKIKQDSKTMEHEMKQASLAVQLQEIQLKKLEVAGKDTSVASEKLAVAKQNETVVIKDNTEKLKENAKAAENLRDKQIKMLDSLGDAIITALEKRYEKEEKLQIDALKKQSDALKKQSDENIKQYDKEYAAKLKLFDHETDEKLKTIQDQIDGIDGLTESEDKALKEREYQAKLAAAQRKVAEAKDDAEKVAAQEELDAMLAEHERAALLASRQAQIEALRAEMDAIKAQAAQKREEMKTELEEKKQHEKDLSDEKIKGLDTEMESVKTHFEDLTTQESLQAEARKLAIDKNNKDIIDLLKTYNPAWQNAGQSFGESLLNGLNSKKQALQAAVAEILALVRQTESSAGNSNTAAPGQEAYLRGLIKNGTPQVAAWARAEAKRLGIPGLKDGGTILDDGLVLVGERGPEILSNKKGASVTPLDKVSNNINLTVVQHIKDRATADYATNSLMKKLQGRGLGVSIR